MLEKNEDENKEGATERPWIVLSTSHDVEVWIDHFNRELQHSVKKGNASGYGICFNLIHGGSIFMHTTSEGEILLDVEEEAEWAVPVICAATGVVVAHSRLWRIPGDALTQLLLGMSTLIASTRMVFEHDFKLKKYPAWR